MTIFGKSTGSWSGETPSIYPGRFRVGDAAVFTSLSGDEGILLFFGGLGADEEFNVLENYNGTSSKVFSMDTMLVYMLVYDIATKRMYNQDVSGSIPDLATCVAPLVWKMKTDT